MVYLGAFLLAFLATVALTPLVLKEATARGILVQPHERRIHKLPIPTLGGIAIFLGFGLGSVLAGPYIEQLPVLLVGGFLLLLVGVMDDLVELRPGTKLAGMILAALVWTIFGHRVEFLTLPFLGPWGLGFFAYPVTVIWMVALTNGVNLIDGLDGLAAGLASIAALVLFGVMALAGEVGLAILLLCVAGAGLGFLPYNFHPARIFMGDSGAMVLGFLLAAVSTMGEARVPGVLGGTVVALGIPLFDTVFSIYRRALAGKPWSQGDRGHIHHRLLGLGWGQRRAVLSLYLISGLLGLGVIWLSAGLAGLIWILLVAGIALRLGFVNGVLRRGGPARREGE